MMLNWLQHVTRYVPMQSPVVTPVLLIILDGFGHRLKGQDNAILQARTPYFDTLYANYAYGTVRTSGHAVGLPKRQFGNSEVGHLNIGAGRVVTQDITRIDDDIKRGTFEKNPVFLTAFNEAKQHTLHILGLLSDGGVHSHENHIHGLIQAAHKNGVKKIAIHAFLDGRDVPPRSAALYLERLENICKTIPGARLAGLCGRYFAMDRDQRWDRIEKAYRLIAQGQAVYQLTNGQEALQAAYLRGENDEFVQPTLIGHASPIQNQDVVLFMNFRADRARQMTEAINSDSFKAFKREQLHLNYYATLTAYGKDFPYPCAYSPSMIKNGLGEYLSSLGLRQLRIAETEKFAHVTYFFNGGQEIKYPHEERLLIPSPAVATYDLQPEMSAQAITNALVLAIQDKKFDLIVCNFANGDMVGHSGVLSASIRAVETLDQCLARCIPSMLAEGGEVIVCADHGNCEQMYDAKNKQPHTQHTMNPSPFFYIGRPATIKPNGALKDVAPSILGIMKLQKPKEMTGRCLIQWQ